MPVGAPRKEQRGHTGLATVDRAPKRGVAKAVSRLDSGAAVQQGPGDLYVPSPGGHVQRGAMLDAVAGVHLRAGLDQRAHDVCATTDPALVGKAIEWSVTTVVGDVGPGSKTQKQLHDGQVARGRRPVQ